jgi:glycine cleavage system transcriptional repressor
MLVRQLIVSAVGVDRPGIVEQFTGHLHSAGANVLDSRMVNLRGQFAIIAVFEADEGSAAGLRKSLPALAQEMGLTLTLASVDTSAPAVPGIPYKLKTYSMDQPGIVHRVSETLRAYGVNIEELVARQESAPFMGTSLFLMEMKLTVPPQVPIRELRSRLQSLCDSLNCDLDFEPA